MSARTKTTSAIATGKLKRESCLVCGKLPAQAHHRDYDRPLEVVWLCPKHHAEEHKRLRDDGIELPGNRGGEIWRLRVPLELVARIKKLAEQEKRSTTKQAHALLEKALGESK